MTKNQELIAQYQSGTNSLQTEPGKTSNAGAASIDALMSAIEKTQRDFEQTSQALEQHETASSTGSIVSRETVGNSDGI